MVKNGPATNKDVRNSYETSVEMFSQVPDGNELEDESFHVENKGDLSIEIVKKTN